MNNSNACLAVTAKHSIRQQNQMRAWVIYLSYLAKSANITFHFGQDCAKTDGKNVFLPLVPCDMSAEEEIIFRSNAEHECGHCVHSNIPFFQSLSRQHPWLGQLLNAIEDSWMEAQVCISRPIASHYFIEGTALLEKNGCVKTGEKSATEAFLMMALARSAMCFGRDDFEPRYEVALAYLSQHLGKGAELLAGIICRFIEARASSSRSTLDNIDISTIIYQIVRDFAEYLGADVNELPGRSGLKVRGAAAELAYNHCSCSVPTEVKALSRRSKKKLAASIKQMLMEPPSDGEVIDFSEGVEQLARDSLDSDCAVVEEGTKITCSESDAPCESSLSAGHDGSDGDVSTAICSLPDYFEALNGVASAVSVMSQRLRLLVQSKAHVKKSVGYRGTKVKASKLYRFAGYDTRVFISQNKKLTESAAISLLCDLSGSTYLSCDMEIRQASILFGSALSYIDIPFSVYGFGHTEVSDLLRIKAFDESYQSARGRFGGSKSAIGGGTPLAESLEALLSKFSARKEAKKIIFVITDGYPNDVLDAVASVERARSQNVQVIHIVFGNYYQWLATEGFPYIHCENAADIPELIIGEIKTLL